MKILLLSTAIVFLLSSCDNATTMRDDITVNPPNPVNPLIGTWVAPNGSITIFTEATVTVINYDGRIAITGTYTFNARTISITVDVENSAVSSPYFFWSWDIIGDKIYISGAPWTRKPEDSAD